MSISSQSRIHKPEAPVQPFDLGLFNQVLLMKQSQFNAGADAVQAKINQLNSNQVIGESQQKYLTDKINGTVEGINSMGGLDFSDRNVLNQTSSYIDNITKDPIINSAINNTRAIQKGTSYFEKLKQDVAAGKKGVYYNPANEYDYMENVNDYVRRSKTDPTARYNDRPITPPVDVNKAMMTAAKDVVASTYVTRDGENRFILKSGEEVSAGRLYETVLTQLQTDPNLANQVRVNAKYNYLQRDAEGNINPAQLSNLRNTYLQSTDNKISQLQNEISQKAILKASAGTPDEKIRLQTQIDNLSSDLLRYESDRSNREGQIDNLLLTNPEAAATNVYSNKLLEGIVSARAYRKEKVQFDQGAMFEARMAFDQEKEQFNQELELSKLALDASKLQLAKDKEAREAGEKTTSADGTSYVSSENSLPTNVKKSAQELELDQVRGVQLQQANTQQDYYYYLYQYRNQDGIIEKVGNTYQPTSRYKGIWQDNMKMLSDLRDGKSIPTTLDPEFIKHANKFQELDLVKKQHEGNVIAVNKEALEVKRKSLNMSDDDFRLFLKGQNLVNTAPKKQVLRPNTGGAFTSSLMQNPYAQVNDYSQIETNPENKKALDIFRKYSNQLVPDKDVVERIYSQKSSQVIPRTMTPVGLKKSDLDARASMLSGQIQYRGYYSPDGSQRPEKTRGEDLSVDKIQYLGDTYQDFGDGAKPYVKAQITRGEGKDKKTETVFVDVDDDYVSNFRNFAQNVNEAMRQEVLRHDKVSYDSMSSDGRNVIKTSIIKKNQGISDETATLQVYVTHDENRKRITPTPVDLFMNKNLNINQATEIAKNFANNYALFYKNALALGQKPTVKAYIDILNSQQ